MNRIAIVQRSRQPFQNDDSHAIPKDDAACLRCHEHNHGGDTYENNLAAKSLGYRNPRLLHPGAKRGTPDRDYDVHYKAGVQCLDCHESHGHLIARGVVAPDSIDAIKQRLTDNGIATTDKKCGCDHSWQIWCKDPNGVDIEFHQYTDQSLQLKGGVAEVNW